MQLSVMLVMLVVSSCLGAHSHARPAAMLVLLLMPLSSLLKLRRLRRLLLLLLTPLLLSALLAPPYIQLQPPQAPDGLQLEGLGVARLWPYSRAGAPGRLGATARLHLALQRGAPLASSELLLLPPPLVLQCVCMCVCVCVCVCICVCMCVCMCV